MAQTVIAPWAELVPERSDGLMTAEELARLPEDGWLYELVEGRLVRMPPPGFEHGDTESALGAILRAHVHARKLGRVATGEVGVKINRPGEPETVLGADVAFVRGERLPARGSPEWRHPLLAAPDLIAEIASPSQYRLELAAKARVWLGAGVQLVWVVWPDKQEVDVWRPGSDEPVSRLRAEDTLDGLDVLPGFTCPVARLFE